MVKLNQLDFKVDGFEMECVVDAIRGVRVVKVEDMADLLTDRSPPATFTPEEIQWMKGTPVASITMGAPYTEGSYCFFDLQADDGKPMLRISARSTTNGEFRGGIVRRVIEAAQAKKDPQLTLYKAFQAHISKPSNNSSFIYATTPPILSFLAGSGFDSNSEVFKGLAKELQERLNIFGQFIFDAWDEFVRLYPRDEGKDLPPKAQAYLQDRLQEVFSVSAIPQEMINFIAVFKTFEAQLQVIIQKSLSFKPGSGAHMAASALAGLLTQARDDLLKGNIGIKQFKETCDNACVLAENSELKNHRGWKQVFETITSTAAAIATLGIMSVIRKMMAGTYEFPKIDTDSIHVLKKMKGVLHNISHGEHQDVPSSEPDTDSRKGNT